MLKAGAAARPLATRILNGTTAAEDAALRRVIRASLTKALEEQEGAEALGEVLFRRFQDKGTMQLLVDQGQLAQGVSGAATAWSRLMHQLIDEEHDLDYGGLDLPRLCTEFAGNLWQYIQHEAARHESPLTNLANQLQLAELTSGFRLKEAPAGDPSGLQVALPKSVFVGREDDIRELDARLLKDRVVLLTGDPGVGKSELTAQWASGQQGRVGWIDASSVSSFRAGVQDLAFALGLDRVPASSQTLGALLALGDVSLVLDDAVPEVLATVMGSRIECQVVVTSIAAPLEYANVALDLRPLTRESLVSLAMTLLPHLEKGAAETVADFFPGQPFGVRQAAPLIGLMGLDRFIEVLMESPAAGQGLGSVPGGRENMAALWKHSLARLPEASAEAGRRSLALLRVLGGFVVPMDLFLGCVAVEIAEDGEWLAGKAECWALINDAKTLRLIDVEHGWVHAHGLLRDYCWDTLDTEARDHCRASVTTALTHALHFTRQEGGPQGLMLLDFVANMPLTLDEGQPMPEHYGGMLTRAVELAVTHGQLEFSLSLVDEGLAAVTQAGDKARVLELVALKLHTLESLASPQSLALINEYAEAIDDGSSAVVRSNFHAHAARAFLRYNEMPSARKHAKAALAAAREVVADGEEHESALLIAHRVSGLVEARDGALELAEHHFNRAINLADNAPDGARVALEIAKRVVDVYTKLDRADLAEKWRDVLLDRVGSSPAGAKYEVALVLGGAGRLPGGFGVAPGLLGGTGPIGQRLLSLA